MSWATFEHPYHPEVQLPWPTVLVALDEGPLFVSNPEGIAPQEMRPSMPVAVRFIECEDDAGVFQLPVFVKKDR